MIVIENAHRTGKRSDDRKYLLSNIGNAPNYLFFGREPNMHIDHLLGVNDDIDNGTGTIDECMCTSPADYKMQKKSTARHRSSSRSNNPISHHQRL